ncbi:DUF6302 family protein [Streptomyces eurythermus]
MSWYRERLLDPALITAGVVVVVKGVGYPTVPVGGLRRGGYVNVADDVTTRCLHEALTGRDGFPRVRVRWSLCPSVCHTVIWGDEPPRDDEDDVAQGRFYGYSEEAINRFVEELAHSTRPRESQETGSSACSSTSRTNSKRL